MSSKRAAEAKNELSVRRSITCGTTRSTRSAAEEVIGSAAVKDASGACDGDNEPVVFSIAAAGSSTSSSACTGDKASATTAVGFSFTEEVADEERLLGSTASVEVAAAAEEETASAAHPSTQIGKGAWGTASATTARSPGGKFTPPPGLLSHFQLRPAGLSRDFTTDSLKSLAEMAMQPQKRISAQKLPVMHRKKQERHATPSYLTGGLAAAILVCAVLIAATVIAKRRQNAVSRSVTHCNRCFMRPIHWLPTCCRYGYCSYCLPLAMMRCHRREWADEPPSPYFCTRRGPMGVVKEQGNVLGFFEDMLPPRKGFEREAYPPWFLTDVEEIKEGGETFTVLWFKNINDCKARKWPKRRRVLFRHVGDLFVERVGEAENLPAAIEYSS